MQEVCNSKPEQLLLLRHLQSLSRTTIQNPHVIFRRHLNMEPRASEAGLILQRSIELRSHAPSGRARKGLHEWVSMEKIIIFWSQYLYAPDYTHVVCGFK